MNYKEQIEEAVRPVAEALREQLGVHLSDEDMERVVAAFRVVAVEGAWRGARMVAYRFDVEGKRQGIDLYAELDIGDLLEGDEDA